METSINQQSDFNNLVNKIQATSQLLQENARLVINRNVTTRAWLTGFYIVEYEQNGNDRAKYGEHLLQNLAKRLNDKGFGLTSLKNYRLFYLYYKDLAEPVVNYLQQMSAKGQIASEAPGLQQSTKGQSLFDFLQITDSQSLNIGHSLTDLLPSQDLGVVSRDGFAMMSATGEVKPVPQMLFSRLSFSHIVQLIKIDNPLERSFYAIETMRGPWSVRELIRQKDANYFERSGWSKKPELLAKKVNEAAEKPSFKEELKTHYVFEFLGLSAKDVIEESELEQAIIDHLEEFMLELGMGFCLEARQKKLLIDDRYFKADLVFYHRILKCHCILEIKAHRLDYADMAQLNMYIEYYRRHYMQHDDNPPVGLLLCTEYGQEMVEYLAPHIDPGIFVAQYELQLPSKERIRDFLMRMNRGSL